MGNHSLNLEMPRYVLVFEIRGISLIYVAHDMIFLTATITH